MLTARISQHVLDWRRATGAERFDEMWDGIPHLLPLPTREHQEIEATLEAWLRKYWAPVSKGRVYHQINVASVGGWPNSYRIPDLVLLLPDRFDIDRNEFFEGAPTAVVEIRSPDDETVEKLPFYAALGVPEVWIIDRSTRAFELQRLTKGGYRKQRPAKDGWIVSTVTGIEFRTVSKRLRLQLIGRPDSVGDVP